MRHLYEILVLAIIALLLAPLAGFTAEAADQFAAAVAHIAD